MNAAPGPAAARGLPALRAGLVSLLIAASVSGAAAAGTAGDAGSPGSAGAPVAAAAAGAAGAPAQRTLDNGLRIAVFPDPHLAMVQVQLLVPAGVAAEPAGEEGVAYVTAELLRHGTTSRDPRAFAQELALLGGKLTSSVGRDYATVNGLFLSGDFESGLELLSDAVIYPIFDPVELRRVQGQALRQLAQLEQSPGLVADDQIWRLAFDGHPYGRPASGSFGPVSELDAGRVREFWSDRYRPDHAVLAIAGDVTPERAIAVADEWFGRWSGKGAEPPAHVRAPAADHVRIRIVDRPGSRAELRLGALAPAGGTPDETALLAAGMLYGGAPADRPGGERSVFGRELRTAYTALADAGLFIVAASAPSDSAGAAVSIMLGDLRALGRPPGEAELASVKRLLKNTFPMSFETLAARTASWLAADFRGSGMEFFDRYAGRVDSLAPAGLARAAQRWLDPSRVVLVAVGPAAALKSQLEKFGKVELARSDTALAQATNRRGEAGPHAAPTLAQRARGRALVAKMLAAHGGLAKLRSIKDTRVEAIAIIDVNGHKLEGSLVQARREPDHMVYITDFGGLATRQTLIGNTGWQLASGDSEAKPADQETVGALKSGFGSDLHHLLLAASDPRARVWARGTETIDTLAALAVVVEPPGQSPRTYYLHPKTYRLLGFDQGDSRSGALARRKFSDFQTVGGILWPYHEQRLLNGETVMQVDVRSVRFNTGVPDAAFEMPASGTTH